MKGRKRDTDVTIVFTQAKTSESWSKAEINVFEVAISDFLSDHAAYPHSVYMTNAARCLTLFLNTWAGFGMANLRLKPFSLQPPDFRKIGKFSRRRLPSKRFLKGPATLAVLMLC